MNDDHHPPCRCGCGELADECGSRPAALGSLTIRPPANPGLIQLYVSEEDDRA